MFRARRPSRARSVLRGRAALAAALLCVYLLAAVGYPIQLPTNVVSGTPFPCQHHHCGCHSAEQCWRECCCFTHEQKLAWAREHHVAVPEHLVNDEHSHPAHAHSAAAVAGVGRWCATPCCRTRQPVLARSTPEERSAGKSGCGRCSASKSRPHQTAGVVIVQALKCRGLSTYWCSVGAVVPPPPALRWEFDWICRGLVVVEPPSFLFEKDGPPVPPPRV